MLMRYRFAIVLSVGVLCVAPGKALAQGSVDAFGGLSVNNITEGSGLPVDFGGRVAVDLIPSVQIVGEVGRIGNVLPTNVTSLLSFTPFDVRASAFYGEGGMRFVAAPHSAVSPYAEATAGISHLSLTVGGLETRTNPITRAALSVLDRTNPIAGVGGGVVFHAGPVVVDLGYRYHQVFADNLIGSLLSAGEHLGSHQVRMGFGVRF